MFEYQYNKSFISRVIDECESHKDIYLYDDCVLFVCLIKKILCFIFICMLVTSMICIKGFRYWGFYLLYKYLENENENENKNKNENKNENYAVNMLILTVLIDVVLKIHKLSKKKKK
jgi:hypothetical protein